MPKKEPLDHLTLGQSTHYPTTYDSQQLHAVPRSLNREPIGIVSDDINPELPFYGEDFWTAYEVSWLNKLGLPQVAVGYFKVPAETPNLVESKSFKLYLNSFNESRFNDWHEVSQIMQDDLSACAGGQVDVTLVPLEELTGSVIDELPGELIDDQEIEISDYDYSPSILRVTNAEQQQTLAVKSNLLKSNCLITNQPDWGSVYIHGVGPELCRESLLRYIISFRRHNEFHEQCVERIFQDLQAVGFKQLTVYARYTRRGGLDINPFRSNFEDAPAIGRLARQ